MRPSYRNQGCFADKLNNRTLNKYTVSVKVKVS